MGNNGSSGSAVIAGGGPTIAGQPGVTGSGVTRTIALNSLISGEVDEAGSNGILDGVATSGASRVTASISSSHNHVDGTAGGGTSGRSRHGVVQSRESTHIEGLSTSTVGNEVGVVTSVTSTVALNSQVLGGGGERGTSGILRGEGGGGSSGVTTAVTDGASQEGIIRAGIGSTGTTIVGNPSKKLSTGLIVTRHSAGLSTGVDDGRSSISDIVRSGGGVSITAGIESSEGHTGGGSASTIQSSEVVGESNGSTVISGTSTTIVGQPGLEARRTALLSGVRGLHGETRSNGIGDGERGGLVQVVTASISGDEGDRHRVGASSAGRIGNGGRTNRGQVRDGTARVLSSETTTSGTPCVEGSGSSRVTLNSGAGRRSHNSGRSVISHAEGGGSSLHIVAHITSGESDNTVGVASGGDGGIVVAVGDSDLRSTGTVVTDSGATISAQEVVELSGDVGTRTAHNGARSRSRAEDRSNGITDGVSGSHVGAVAASITSTEDDRDVGAASRHGIRVEVVADAHRVAAGIVGSQVTTVGQPRLELSVVVTTGASHSQRSGVLGDDGRSVILKNNGTGGARGSLVTASIANVEDNVQSTITSQGEGGRSVVVPDQLSISAAGISGGGITITGQISSVCRLHIGRARDGKVAGGLAGDGRGYAILNGEGGGLSSGVTTRGQELGEGGEISVSDTVALNGTADRGELRSLTISHGVGSSGGGRLTAGISGSESNDGGTAVTRSADIGTVVAAGQGSTIGEQRSSVTGSPVNEAFSSGVRAHTRNRLSGLSQHGRIRIQDGNHLCDALTRVGEGTGEGTSTSSGDSRVSESGDGEAASM